MLEKEIAPLEEEYKAADVAEKIENERRRDAAVEEELLAMRERYDAFVAGELPHVAEIRRKAEAVKDAALDAARAQGLDVQMALVNATRRKSRVSDVVYMLEQYAEAARRDGRDLAHTTTPVAAETIERRPGAPPFFRDLSRRGV
jgi:hypothetical protein